MTIHVYEELGNCFFLLNLYRLLSQVRMSPSAPNAPYAHRVCVCVIGLVRAIDPIERVFFVLTPVPPEQLRAVNSLVKGASDLPQCILMQQVRLSYTSYCIYVLLSPTSLSILPSANI